MKKNILFLVIGFILASGIGTLAYSYTAKQVSFTPNDKNWNVKTVEEAINSLKNSNETAEEKIQAYENKITEYEGKIENYETKISELESNKGANESKIAEYEEKIEKCEKKIEEYEKKISELETTTKICELKSGNALEVGSMYECNPSLGGTTKYNFYVLKTEGNFVKLIMQRNISDTVGSARTMDWNTAMNFFRNGSGTSLNWKTAVDLPDAQTIADVVGNTGWKTAEKDYNGWFCFGTGYTQACGSNSGALKNDSQTQKYKWLFNYTRECENSGCDSATSLDSNYAYGYWTRDMVSKQLDTTVRAWRVDRHGNLRYYGVSNTTHCGVRPVITISKSNIS